MCVSDTSTKGNSFFCPILSTTVLSPSEYCTTRQPKPKNIYNKACQNSKTC